MCVCVCVCVSRSVMSNSVTPWTVTHQGPLSMEFSRQEYWSGLPFPSPGDLPDPGLEPRFLSSYIPASLVAQTVKNLPTMRETWVWEDPWVGRSPGGGHSNPLQYSCLENPMDRGAWRATIHGVAELDTTEQLAVSLSFMFRRQNNSQ